ncbi:hypothetical protein [Leifsonia shinshuensis]|uniref:Uncharacterized protein n=1 Tax=Leifsonia shinshuensis TaxID=150026 RepID=A0A7G6YCD5_9MICO|nr:hypothetical protein [Leifsonia shinshuensis]QNE36150.1 hypothetical protein F1C12_14205 [Leifsonia shinshuensis]
MLLTAAALALASGAPAQAAPDDGTAPIRGFLAQYGADGPTQDRLLAEYRAGGVWDSMSSSKQPVSTRSFTGTDGAYTVGTYADGSIAVTRMETPDPTASDRARGIGGCSVSGKVYSNCKIDTWVGVVSMAFRASYNLGTNQVTNAYGPEYTIVGACGASPSLSRPAGNMARLNIATQMCVLPYSTVFWLQLTVSGGSARVSWNDY